MSTLRPNLTAKLDGLHRVSVRTRLGTAFLGSAEAGQMEIEVVLTLSAADAARVRSLPEEWVSRETARVFDATSGRFWHVARFDGKEHLWAMLEGVPPSAEAG